MRAWIAAAALVAAGVVGLNACGDDAEPRRGQSQGAELAGSLGCSSCHSTNGDRKQGPTWKDLAGSDVPLDDGTTVEANTAYLTRSIEDPGAEIVDGYLPIMPDLNVDEEQVEALVAYIQELT